MTISAESTIETTVHNDYLSQAIYQEYLPLLKKTV